MNKGSAALTGAGTGAAVGTAVMPGIGTAVGAGLGAIGGWLLGDSGGGAPSYDPNAQNFQYGLGQYVDAQGVVHPTPEERAQMAAQAKAQNQQRQQEIDKALAQADEMGLAPNDPRRRWLEGLQLQAVTEGDKQQQDIATMGGQDSFAAQRTRELVGRQQALAGVAEGALGREAPQQANVANNGQDYLDSQKNQHLFESRNQQLAAIQGLQRFAQAPEGPSAAQAQLQAGTDMAARQQYGMARAQPGGGGAALRNAAFNAAGISGNAANQAAMLRAQETQAYKQQQLAALGAIQTGAGQFRAGDQSIAAQQAQQANVAAQQQIQVGQNNLNAQLQGQQQNDAMFLGTNAQIQGYDAMRDSQARAQQAAGMGYEGAKLQGAGLGAANFNSAQQQSNTELGMGLGAASAGLSAYTASQNAEKGGGASGTTGATTSDVRAKKNIERTDVLKALGGGATYPTPSQPDTRALDDAYRSQGGKPTYPMPNRLWTNGPSPDLRPAQGYEYSYRDPQADGAGRYVGPMAQDLEHLPGVVSEGPGGKKAIDAPRLTLVNTAALSQQQRELDEIKRRQEQMMALGGAQSASFPMPSIRPPDYAALDQAAGR